ncbi:ty3-gypsy retrotransposon protein [Cucumis melo var. makuwa]|nr:ty3-gypsy retrotransposon protein [Cucumis melo var. makuwa]
MVDSERTEVSVSSESGMWVLGGNQVFSYLTQVFSRETQPYEDMPSFEVTKNIWEQLLKPPKGGIVIKENPMIDKHNLSSKHSSEEMLHPNIMSVMMIDVDTSEDRMIELEKKINMLIKAVEARNYEIASLKNHIESRDASESSHNILSRILTKGRQLCKKVNHKISTSIVSLSVQQLQEMTANFIKTQYGGPVQTFSFYSKPYTKRIDNLKMLKWIPTTQVPTV